MLTAGAVVMTAIMTKLIARLRGSFKPFQKSTFIYIILFVLFFAVIAIAAVPIFFHDNLSLFIFLQFYFLALGICHVFFMNKKIEWAGEEKGVIPEMLFTILIGLFGCTFFLAIYHALNKNGFEYLMVCTSFFFIIPFFFYHSFQKAIAIPPKVLKQWFYPVGEEIDEPEDSKIKNLIVISFEFQKNEGDSKVTNFRAKAPRDMEFGELFYYFINDYNVMNENSRIQFKNAFGEPYGWIFYKKHNWHSIVTDYIDTENTFNSNHIKENDVIICTRSHT